jgi:NAD-dependent dihydropyrimidine dehydrogenase PreA subunit
MIVYETLTGEIRVDPIRCRVCLPKLCVAACPEDILEILDGVPVLAKPAEAVQRGLCRECLACEVTCATDGASGLALFLPIEGLDS